MKSNKYLVFIAIGFELVGLIVAAAILGKYLDDTYGLKGLGLIGLSFLALAGWLVHIIALVKKIESNTKTDE